MSTAATQKLLDGTLAELSDIETHEVSLVPLGANGLPLLAVKGIAGEYTTATPPVVEKPAKVPDTEDKGEAKITLTAAAKALWTAKLGRVEAALGAIKRAVVGAVVGETDSEDVGAIVAKIGKALVPAPEVTTESDALAQLAKKLLAQPRVTADETETATLMQRAAEKIERDRVTIQKLTRELERAGSRLSVPAADPHGDDVLPTRKSSAFPVHWKAGKACGLSDED